MSASGYSINVKGKNVSVTDFAAAYDDLSRAVLNRNYNFGELRIGKNGRLEIINNHKHTFFHSNDTTTTRDENKRVRQAVYDILKTKFDKNESDAVLAHVKEYLCGDANIASQPLTRDEVKNMIKVLGGNMNVGSAGRYDDDALSFLRKSYELKHGVAVLTDGSLLGKFITAKENRVSANVMSAIKEGKKARKTELLQSLKELSSDPAERADPKYKDKVLSKVWSYCLSSAYDVEGWGSRLAFKSYGDGSKLDKDCDPVAFFRAAVVKGTLKTLKSQKLLPLLENMRNMRTASPNIKYLKGMRFKSLSPFLNGPLAFSNEISNIKKSKADSMIKESDGWKKLIDDFIGPEIVNEAPKKEQYEREEQYERDKEQYERDAIRRNVRCMLANDIRAIWTDKDDFGKTLSDTERVDQIAVSGHLDNEHWNAADRLVNGIVEKGWGREKIGEELERIKGELNTGRHALDEGKADMSKIEIRAEEFRLDAMEAVVTLMESFLKPENEAMGKKFLPFLALSRYKFENVDARPTKKDEIDKQLVEELIDSDECGKYIADTFKADLDKAVNEFVNGGFEENALDQLENTCIQKLDAFYTNELEDLELLEDGKAPDSGGRIYRAIRDESNRIVREYQSLSDDDLVSKRDLSGVEEDKRETRKAELAKERRAKFEAPHVRAFGSGNGVDEGDAEVIGKDAVRQYKKLAGAFKDFQMKDAENLDGDLMDLSRSATEYKDVKEKAQNTIIERINDIVKDDKVAGVLDLLKKASPFMSDYDDTGNVALGHTPIYLMDFNAAFSGEDSVKVNTNKFSVVYEKCEALMGMSKDEIRLLIDPVAVAFITSGNLDENSLVSDNHLDRIMQYAIVKAKAIHDENYAPNAVAKFTGDAKKFTDDDKKIADEFLWKMQTAVNVANGQMAPFKSLLKHSLLDKLSKFNPDTVEKKLKNWLEKPDRLNLSDEGRRVLRLTKLLSSAKHDQNAGNKFYNEKVKGIGGIKHDKKTTVSLGQNAYLEAPAVRARKGLMFWQDMYQFLRRIDRMQAVMGNGISEPSGLSRESRKFIEGAEKRFGGKRAIETGENEVEVNEDRFLELFVTGSNGKAGDNYSGILSFDFK